MKEMIGKIDHRILLNYRINPEVMQKNLPPSFKVKTIRGKAIGGICQVSLSEMHPKGLPSVLSSQSHNAAHRIAVTSSEGEGVYVPRRDTNSWLNQFAGGKIFPGVYYKAKFDVSVKNETYFIQIKDQTDKLIMEIDASVTNDINSDSVFNSIDEISDFFKNGNIGWSPQKNSNKFDTIELKVKDWQMKPLKVQKEFSSFFSDTNIFPQGSVEFDSAMIMQDLRHSWIAREELCEVCC